MRKLLCLLFCAFLLLGTAQGQVTLLPPLTDEEIRDMSQVGRTMQILVQEGWERFKPELTAEDRFLKSGLFDVVSLVPAQSDWRGLLLDLLTLESAADYRAVLRKPYAGIIDSMTGDSKEDALAASERVYQAAGIDKILPYRRFFACPRYAEMQTVWTVIAGDGNGRWCLLWLDANLELQIIDFKDPWHGQWGEALTPEQTEAALTSAARFSDTVWPGLADEWTWQVRPQALIEAADEEMAVVWAGQGEEGVMVALGVFSGRVYYSVPQIDEEAFLQLPKLRSEYED